MNGIAIQDHLFPYYVSANGYEAHCHVRLIRKGTDVRDEDVLVIMSELASNEGMSVCNAFEDLLPQIVFTYKLDPARLTVVEHWGPFSYNDGNRDEEFTCLTYTYEPDRPTRIGFRYPLEALTKGAFIDPSWEPISRSDVETLAGGELPPFPFVERPTGFGLSSTREVER